MSAAWLPWLVALPAIASLAVAATGRWPNLREAMAVLSALAVAGALALFVPEVAAGARPSITLFTIVPGIGLTFTLEPIGVIFALVASSLWALTTVYAAGYMRANQEHAQTRFFVCFALAIAAAVGIAFAGNLVTLFIFYEMLTLSTYPLVTHHGDRESRDGGRVYLGILLTTSIGFFLPAIVVTWLLTGSVMFTAGGLMAGTGLGGLAAAGLYLLFAYGCGKAALMPFHRWLPAAMVAPTPVSALLHAVAVVKAGVFTVLKVTVYIFGLDFARSSAATLPVMWIAAFTLLAASVVALFCDNLKKRLAYSTISQLSYIVLGAGMATRTGMVGATMHLVMHAFGKITLFFCAGAIYTAVHKKLVSELDGLGRAMPFTFAAFGLAALSIVGLPPLGGTWSKWVLMSGALAADHGILVAVLALSSLLNIGYLLDIPARAFFAPAKQPTRGHEAPLACVVPLCLTALACVVLFFLAGPLARFIQPVASP